MKVRLKEKSKEREERKKEMGERGTDRERESDRQRERGGGLHKRGRAGLQPNPATRCSSVSTDRQLR